MNQVIQIISISEKIGDGVGEIGMNLIFSTIATLLLFFL